MAKLFLRFTVLALFLLALAVAEPGKRYKRQDEEAECSYDQWLQKYYPEGYEGVNPVQGAEDYDWEQIGRHFMKYGKFTNRMTDDLTAGLDFRFAQMMG